MQNSEQLELFDIPSSESKKSNLKIAEITEPEVIHENATFMQRGFAFFIDIVIVETLMSSIWAIFKPAFIFTISLFISTDKVQSAQVIFLVLAEALLFLWYFSTLTTIFGFTLGKFVANIRVVNIQKSSVPIKSAILRHLPCFMVFALLLGYSFSPLKPLFYLTTYFMLLDFFLPLFRKDKKTIHDIFSRTMVVKALK